MKFRGAVQNGVQNSTFLLLSVNLFKLANFSFIFTFTNGHFSTKH